MFKVFDDGVHGRARVDGHVNWAVHVLKECPCDCSISPQKTNKHSPSKQGSVHVPVWAAFGGPAPGSNDYTPLLGQAPNGPTDGPHEGHLLTSPRMSSPGHQEPARPMLDVEFTNMGLRLKGTGRKVLAGVTGRLRESHLTAIMGPSGAGEPFAM